MSKIIKSEPFCSVCGKKLNIGESVEASLVGKIDSNGNFEMDKNDEWDNITCEKCVVSITVDVVDNETFETKIDNSLTKLCVLFKEDEYGVLTNNESWRLFLIMSDLKEIDSSFRTDFDNNLVVGCGLKIDSNCELIDDDENEIEHCPFCKNLISECVCGYSDDLLSQNTCVNSRTKFSS